MPTHQSITIQELNSIAGYVENGTSDIVTIYQDDATRYWTVKVGRTSFCASSLGQALIEAHAATDQFAE